ncbi:hypothetical protein M197_gp24 [Haloarcula hispanica tailed virus 2]|uniref:Uncharacterized protein n=1 Tax=Haloarcula hispanica tailed virus 2 TaxID=1273751 RepID=R4T679_9CAUD|nr:hypothetical protein M197_gp24 [Haloarcula hispanica tailed virus 2]AGM11189.1 hypothetical protein HHTV2_24 [Haloarcula hispanica tailed virus 2]
MTETRRPLRFRFVLWVHRTLVRLGLLKGRKWERARREDDA